MQIFLTRELESWLRERVRGGAYQSEAHVVRRALHLLREHEATLPPAAPRTRGHAPHVTPDPKGGRR